MKRFELTCPECLTVCEVSFDNIAVGGWGSYVHFKCTACGIQHMLGGKPQYRELKKDNGLYIFNF